MTVMSNRAGKSKRLEKSRLDGRNTCWDNGKGEIHIRRATIRPMWYILIFGNTYWITITTTNPNNMREFRKRTYLVIALKRHDRRYSIKLKYSGSRPTTDIISTESANSYLKKNQNEHRAFAKYKNHQKIKHFFLPHRCIARFFFSRCHLNDSFHGETVSLKNAHLNISFNLWHWFFTSIDTYTSKPIWISPSDASHKKHKT